MSRGVLNFSIHSKTTHEILDTQRALYFPDVTGTILSGGKAHSTDMFKGKVSVVAILNARISAEHVESFVADVLQDWEGDSLFQYVQVSIPCMRDAVRSTDVIPT